MLRDRRGIRLLFTPPPTPNGPLHLGHLSGPYLAGDIAARAARARGSAVLTICGLDSHQNYVPARAQQLGQPVEHVVERFGDEIRQAMQAARIAYDVFVDPLGDDSYRNAVAGLLSELVDLGVIGVEPTALSACSQCGRILHHVRVAGTCPTCGQGASGGTCEGCGSFLTAGDLLAATSSCCGAAPTSAQLPVPVLRLENYREQLQRAWSGAALPPAVRALVARYLAEGLPDVPVAYPTDWGIPWPHRGAEMRIDVWIEMGLGYLSAVARHLDPTARSLEECRTAWSGVAEMWHTLGIDNAFYYSTMIPALLVAAGLRADLLAGLVVNKFYRMNGLKFSTSRNHAIWAHEFLAEHDPALVRAYLAWDRPDRSETDFRLTHFTAFADWYEDVLAGDPPSTFPQGLAEAELDRAERALALDSFDSPLAVRCALTAFASCPQRAGTVLGWITGSSVTGTPRYG